MPNFNTTIKTAQAANAYKRNAAPSFRALQQPVRYALFDYTFAGTETNADTITLGCLGVVGAKIIPELSGIRDTGATGDVDFDALLQSVTDAGTATALTAAASVDNNRAAFATLASGALPAVGANDDLRLLLSNVEAVTASETIRVEVAYVSENAQ